MNDLILAHYTAEPLVFDAQRTYAQHHPTFKPHGLWLTIDGEDGWRAWCEYESFHPESLAHRTEFRLRENANILHLESHRDVLHFTAKYADKLTRLRGWVDWSRVVDQYDGVLIAPYLWSARMAIETTWYSTWDCASGCFWNLDAIELVPAAVTA